MTDPDEGTWRYCAVCARPLETRAGLWFHNRALLGDSDLDHPAVPVGVEDVTPVYRCDCCDGEPITHEVEADSFNHPPPVQMHRSVGGWALCALCAPLLTDAIKARNPGRLVQRAYDQRPTGSTASRAYLRQLYDKLLANITSDVRLVAPDGPTSRTLHPGS